MSRAYYHLNLIQLAIFPLLGLLSTYDMCKSYVYYQSCKDIFTTNAAITVLRLLYFFYVSYLAKSYYRRVERGELILVNHGRAIVELINTVQNNNNSQRSRDIELTAV